MLLQIPQILNADEVAEYRQVLDAVEWVDGRVTAGHLSSQVKKNAQARHDHPTVRELGGLILSKLERDGLFMSAALPSKVLPPLFNRYGVGEQYGPHIDGAIRPVEGTPHRIRTDLSATLFLSAPDEYDGGDLVIEDVSGERRVKLPAGDMVLYSGSSVHHVEPVTRGARIASFFWVQSMVRDDGERTMLFKLDRTIQQLRRERPESATIIELTNLYHNLLRRWADI